MTVGGAKAHPAIGWWARGGLSKTWNWSSREAGVVGYDDSALAEALDLTSVHQPFAETGRIAIPLLFGAMDGTADSTQQISLKPRLATGGTT
jgi:DNA-binding LacI/PurR family transcriptional regulator